MIVAVGPPFAGELVVGLAEVVVAVTDFDGYAEPEAIAVLEAEDEAEADAEALAETEALPVSHGSGDAVAVRLADADAVGSALWLAPAEELAEAAEPAEWSRVPDTLEEAVAVAVLVQLALAVVPEAAAAGKERTVP